ncbi:MAG: nicotinate-nucleotide adenylyltransferase [Anaerolineales bacterium]
MKIGIFGGTFDPPHVGHLILAEEAQAQFVLDHVLWVLTSYPPHKKMQKISPLQDRMTMVLLAIADNQNFSLSRVDIDRQPPHYAIDTVKLLREKYPSDKYIYLMGADSLFDLPNWHDPVQFVAQCHGLGIMKRHGEFVDTTQLEAEIPGLREKIHFLEAPIIEISGSDIRRRVENGLQFRYFVPDKIYHYIMNHKLYQS